MSLYKLFIPPANYIDKDPRSWTRKEAEGYLEWFLTIRKERVENFRHFMDIKEFPANELAWNAIAEKLYDLVMGDDFSIIETYPDPFMQEQQTRRSLTNQGYALAGDMGLFFFEVIEQKVDHELNWQVGKGPKGFVSHNQPVIIDNHSDQVDPLWTGIVTVQSIINAVTDKYRWFSKYNVFLKACK